MGLALSTILPADWRDGSFLGRIDSGAGPTPVLISGGELVDLTPTAATVSSAIEKEALSAVHGTVVARFGEEAILPDNVRLLSPLDLQCVKASGVTFAVSAIERVIEERARGDASKAAEIRALIEERVGHGIRSVVPGSAEADEMKRLFIEQDMWSQYLEVAIGPDAEIFTKSPVLSTVGHGAAVGIRSDSDWNNPEPEILLIADSKGGTIGAALGNDVNLRDFEGRSALLLGKAKDNNASCAVGPFIRLFDESYTIDDVRAANVDLVIEGEDGFVLTGSSRMNEISRDPLDLVKQAMSEHHYPDGLALFLGTLFAPTQDRSDAGGGFTHKLGDRVTISSERLGVISNIVMTSKDAPAWEFGIAELIRNLAARQLIDKV